MARRTVLAIACVVSAVALTSCGSREAAVLGTAFQNHPKTADLTINLLVEGEAFTFDAALSGPYQDRGARRLPAFDFKLHIAGSTPGGVDGRLISDGKDVFVQYKGVTYETGERAIRVGLGFNESDVRRLLNDAGRWFPDSETRASATLDGEAVTRVTGNLDVKAALTDLAKLLEKSGGGESFRESDVNDTAADITDARFTVDVGKSDGKLRRIDARLAFDTQDQDASIRFSIRWRNLDKPVTINAPKSGKPIGELGKILDEDLGDLGGTFS
jgi:hypothetical protein